MYSRVKLIYGSESDEIDDSLESWMSGHSTA